MIPFYTAAPPKPDYRSGPRPKSPQGGGGLQTRLCHERSDSRPGAAARNPAGCKGVKSHIATILQHRPQPHGPAANERTMNGSINDSAAQQQRDEKFMRMAINEARQALKREEVPIGAVVVAGDRVVGRGHNLVETLQDATAHAEMQALTAASSTLGGKYLRDCTLYVTVEPCVMCAGAIAWSQAARVVWGADDPKRGYTTVEGLRLHPQTVVVRGVLAPNAKR